MKNIKFLILYENHDDLKNHNILHKNLENQENDRFSCENHETKNKISLRESLKLFKS